MQVLQAEWQQKVADQISVMVTAAKGDWSSYLDGIEGLPSIHWVAAFDKYYNRRRIQDVIDRADPDSYDNEYVVTCIELGAVIGETLRREHGKLAWLYDWPYWESSLYDHATGTRVNVFHWAMKKMSEYGVDDGFAEKIQACAELLRRGFKEDRSEEE